MSIRYRTIRVLPCSSVALCHREIASSLYRCLTLMLIWLVKLYQVTLGPILTGHCRFEPTCSVYAIEALREHGALRGSWLAICRLLRCHPLGGFGYDPVPDSDRASSEE